jgi:hypothetical protein
MKTTAKALLIIVIVFVILAVLSFGTYIIGKRFFPETFTRVDDFVYKTETKYFDSADEVRFISVDGANIAIELKESDDNEVHVKYATDEYHDYDISVTDGVLNIKFFEIEDIKDNNNHNTAGSALKIEVPDRLVSAEINGTNSVVNIKDLRFSDSLKITTTNALIAAKEISAGGSISVTSTNAGINIDIDGKPADYSVIKNNAGEPAPGTVPVYVNNTNGLINVEFDD